MKADDVLKKLAQLENTFKNKRTNDVKTKFQVIALTSNAKELVQYRVPMQPIEVSEDRKYFTCPRCGQKFECEGEDTVDDFPLCQTCGQLWQDIKK